MGTSLYEQYQASQGGGSASLYDQYVASKKASDAGAVLSEHGLVGPQFKRHQSGHSKFTPAQLVARADRAVDQARDDESAEPSYGERVAGGVASLASGPAETVLGGLRSIVSGQSYREGLKDVQGLKEQAPKPVRVLNSVLGAIPQAAAIPGSPVVAGARYGILSGAAQSNPDATVQERLHDAAREGTIGAVAGGTAQVLGKAVRTAKTGAEIMRSPTRGQLALARADEVKTADRAAFGAAEREGAASTLPSSVGPVVNAEQQALRSALEADGVKRFADMVRESRAFQGADDAAIARETLKLMSKQEGGLLKRLKTQGFDAAADLERQNLALAREELMQAASPLMPSLPGARGGHAEMMRANEAGELASRVANRTMRGTATPDRRLLTESPEAFAAAVTRMTPEQKAQAIKQVLARARENVGISGRPTTGFGVGTSLRRVSRVEPMLTALRGGAPGTSATARILRPLLISAGEEASPFTP